MRSLFADRTDHPDRADTAHAPASRLVGEHIPAPRVVLARPQGSVATGAPDPSGQAGMPVAGNRR